MTASDPNLKISATDALHTHFTSPRGAPAATPSEPLEHGASAKTEPPPDLQKIAASIRQLSVDLPWSMELSFDADVKDSVIVVRNQATGEVVRQIPSEQAVALQRFVEGGNPKDEPPLGLLLDTLT
ncbi:MAG: flagellar protein FlaG [Thiotrichales bacterium]